jgi:hypothetical protein
LPIVNVQVEPVPVHASVQLWNEPAVGTAVNVTVVPTGNFAEQVPFGQLIAPLLVTTLPLLLRPTDSVTSDVFAVVVVVVGVVVVVVGVVVVVVGVVVVVVGDVVVVGVVVVVVGDVVVVGVGVVVVEPPNEAPTVRC